MGNGLRTEWFKKVFQSNDGRLFIGKQAHDNVVAERLVMIENAGLYGLRRAVRNAIFLNVAVGSGDVANM